MSILLRKLTATIFSLLTLIIALFFSLSSHALEGGTPVNAPNYPGLVMLSYDGPDVHARFKNCSGIVLEPRRVLTSTSCLNSLFSNPPIPANNIYVHPSSNGNIGPFLIKLDPSVTPNVSVTSYAIHPQNTFAGGPYALAVLYLSSNINISPSYIYNGNNQFTGSSTTALGWEKTQGSGPIISNEYQLRRLSFPIITGNSNINGLCYDSFTLTGTVFCGGFRNNLKFLQSHDAGAPIYRIVNGKYSAIGLLTFASSGMLFDGQYIYERYARLSSMVSFIRQHAPNTKFWKERSVVPQPPSITSPASIIPILQLLLLDE